MKFVLLQNKNIITITIIIDVIYSILTYIVAESSNWSSLIKCKTQLINKIQLKKDLLPKKDHRIFVFLSFISFLSIFIFFYGKELNVV